MSKFLQLADDIEADLKEMDADADALNDVRLKNKEAARVIFNDHHSAQNRIAEGLARMRSAVHDMSGSNSAKAGEGNAAKAEEVSGATSEASFPKAAE